MPRKPIVGGNWKCNPDSKAKLDGLIANINGCADLLGDCEVYVCPSPLHVMYCVDKFSPGIMCAPQNCNFKGCGAYTGEMAVEQMKDLGCTACLIGHSERRGEFGLPTPAESNELLLTKAAYIIDAGLTCILAIGEPLPIREKGIEAVVAYCKPQIEPFAELLKANNTKMVIAYEPVWSIGTGVTASPEQAQETHAALRAYISELCGQETADAIRIQYGGSANAKNAPDLSACPDVDGFLVGGASLKPEFKDIVAAISAAKA